MRPENRNTSTLGVSGRNLAKFFCAIIVETCWNLLCKIFMTPGKTSQLDRARARFAWCEMHSSGVLV